jgi:hypothetical protein
METTARRTSEPCRHRIAKLVRDDNDPLPERDIRQNATDEVCRLVAHPPPSATGADGSPFARQGDEQALVTALAPEHGKAVREDAALQIVAELLLDVLRKRNDAFAVDLFEERFELRTDNLIQRGLLRSSRAILRVIATGRNPKALRPSFEAIPAPPREKSMPPRACAVSPAFSPRRRGERVFRHGAASRGKRRSRRGDPPRAEGSPRARSRACERTI